MISEEFDITQVVTPFANGRTRHGTNAGYTLHQELGEGPCVPCYLAKQAYDKRYRSADAKTLRSRAHASAQFAAYRELARRHKAEYDELYREEKRKREV